MDSLQALANAVNLVAGWIVGGSWLPREDWSLAAWLLTPPALAMFGVVALERIRPYRPRQPGHSRALTATYFLLTGKISIFVIAVASLRPLYASYGLPTLNLNERLPWPLYVVTTLLTLQFVDYWAHRWLHRNPLLWHLHKVHHAPTHLTWATRFHQHFATDVLSAPLWALTSLFLGVRLVAPFGAFLTLVDYLTHANVAIDFLWLNYVVTTPQVHRYHHSAAREHFDCNFGATFPIWDIVFGTFCYDAVRPPDRFGIVEPMPGSFLGQQVQPLKWIARDVITACRSVGNRPRDLPLPTPPID